MTSSDIYNSGYNFAREQREKRNKILKLITFIFPIIILITLGVGFITSLDVFKGRSENVNKVFTQEDQENEKIKAYQAQSDAYKNAGIPYTDPKNRFSIIFMTPFVSSQVGVVINSDKDYDKVKAEADSIIASAKRKVNISSITYLNNFENK